MATKFQIIGGTVGDRGEYAKMASEFIAEIEANGGAYIDSHSAIGGTGQERMYMLTVVYREPSEPMTPEQMAEVARHFSNMPRT